MIYGYCPICGAKGKSRERRINGDDRCENDHVYPSSTALKTPPENDTGKLIKAKDIQIGTKFKIDGEVAEIISYSKQGDEVVVLEDETGSKIWYANINDIISKII